MKKNIMTIGIALIGLIFVLKGNSWAEPRGGAQRQKWDKPANHAYHSDRSHSSMPGIQHHRPLQRPIPQLKGLDHHRAPYRFAPKYRNWPNRPLYRPFYPKRPFWRHHHGPAMNRYHGSAGSYWPQDAFSALAMISDAGFAFSIRVSETN